MALNNFNWRDRVSRFRRDTRRGDYGSTASGAPKYPTFDPYPEGGSYDTPGYDRRRVETLTQQQAAPQISQLNRRVQNVGARYYKNPLERKEAIRGATEGYGAGISNIMAGARTAGAATYAPEYAEATYAARREADDALRKRMMDWQTGKEEALGKYESEMTAYRTEMEDQYRREAISRASSSASDARYRAMVGQPFRPATPIKRAVLPGEPGYSRSSAVDGDGGGTYEAFMKAGGLDWEGQKKKKKKKKPVNYGTAEPGEGWARDKYGRLYQTNPGKGPAPRQGYTFGSINS